MAYEVITVETENPRPIDMVANIFKALGIVTVKDTNLILNEKNEVCGKFEYVSGPKFIVDFLSKATNYKPKPGEKFTRWTVYADIIDDTIVDVEKN